MKTKNIASKALVVIAIASPILLQAQVPQFTTDTSDVPVDGGISLLVAAGLGYGIKKRYTASKIAGKKKPASTE